MPTYFPKLRSAQVVEKALDRMVEHEIMVAIVGPAGVGKTVPLQHWRKTRGIPHVWIEATLGGSLSALVGALAEGVGIGAGGSLDAKSVKIAETLALAPRAVIIDESDFLQNTALNRVRAIYDRAQMIRDDDDGRAFPLALIGTEALRTRLRRDEERAEQMLRRIGEFDTVPKLNQAECVGILEARWGLDGKHDVGLAAGSAEELLRLSRGSIGWLNKIVPLAIDLAKRDGKTITPQIVRATARYLVGVEA
jgi:type II secretory pathway predicted ATPase ExeA